jgi:type I restriction enzyme S subunit
MAGKYRTYPEYKDSGDSWVGNMPSHWKLSRVKYIGKVIGGYAFKSSDFIDSGINAIKISNVSHLSFDWTDSSYLPLKFMDEQSDYIPPNGSLVFAMTRPIISGGVKVAKLQDERPFLVNQRVGFLKPSKKVNQDFLMFVTQSESFFCAFENNITTTNQPNISSEGIEDIRFIFPGISEQQKIANFLDHETAKIDILIEKQQQLIALLKEKRQAVISHSVTKGLNANAPMRDSGVEWLGEVPEHWVSCALKYYARIVDCKHITAEFFDEGIPLASIGEVKEWHVNLATAKLTNEKYYLDLIGGGRKPEAGDIIYSRNATVGEAALVVKDMPDFAMGQDVCLIRLDEGVLPEYILYVLKSGVISNQLDLAMVGSTFKRINVDDIRNFVIALPSYEEQIDIVAELTRILGKYDALVTNAESTVGLLTERRTALISAAVTGKIDVRDFNPKDSEAC